MFENKEMFVNDKRFENKKMFKLENDKQYEDEKTSESNRMRKETMERSCFVLEDPSDEPLKCGGVRLALCGVTLAAAAFTGYWSIGMLDYSVFINTIASSRQELFGIAAWNLITAGIILLGASGIYQLLNWKQHPQSPVVRQQLNYVCVLLLLGNLLMLATANIFYVLMSLATTLPSALLTLPLNLISSKSAHKTLKA
jgi:hypothetical protein